MYRNLAWIAMGTFAIGTESFVIAGVLPEVAADLSVSVADAGHLVTVFALVYALAAPVLAAFIGHWPRELVLRAAMAVFALGNFAAAFAPSFAVLMAARILMALCASLYSPTAAAYAGYAVAPEQRGRALAFVMMGMTVATILGVPIATFVGVQFGWRNTFALVGVVALVALFGLCLPRTPQARSPAIPLGHRLAVARRAPVWRSLLVTWLAFSGTFCVYTYISQVTQHVGGPEFLTYLPLILMSNGIAGAVGTMAGGRLVDRNGAHHVIVRVLSTLTLIFAAIAAISGLMTGTIWGGVATVVLMALWGFINWQLPSAQQHHLIQLEPQAAPVVLSLQASFLYLGVSTGALLGSLALRYGSASQVVWVSAVLELLALGAWLWNRSVARRTEAAATA